MHRTLLTMVFLAFLVFGLLLGGCGKTEPVDPDLLGFAKQQVEKDSGMKATLGDMKATLGDVDPATLTVADSKNVNMEEGIYRWARVDGKTKDGRTVMLNVEFQPKDGTTAITNFRVDKGPN